MTERRFLIAACFLLATYCIFGESSGVGGAGWVLLALLMVDNRISRIGGTPNG